MNYTPKCLVQFYNQYDSLWNYWYCSHDQNGEMLRLKMSRYSSASSNLKHFITIKIQWIQSSLLSHWSKQLKHNCIHHKATINLSYNKDHIPFTKQTHSCKHICDLYYKNTFGKDCDFNYFTNARNQGMLRSWAFITLVHYKPTTYKWGRSRLPGSLRCSDIHPWSIFYIRAPFLFHTISLFLKH